MILEKPCNYADTADLLGFDRRRRDVEITITDRPKAAAAAAWIIGIVV